MTFSKSSTSAAHLFGLSSFIWPTYFRCSSPHLCVCVCYAFEIQIVWKFLCFSSMKPNECQYSHHTFHFAFVFEIGPACKHKWGKNKINKIPIQIACIEQKISGWLIFGDFGVSIELSAGKFLQAFSRSVSVDFIRILFIVWNFRQIQRNWEKSERSRLFQSEYDYLEQPVYWVNSEAHCIPSNPSIEFVCFPFHLPFFASFFYLFMEPIILSLIRSHICEFALNFLWRAEHFFRFFEL